MARGVKPQPKLTPEEAAELTPEKLGRALTQWERRKKAQGINQLDPNIKPWDYQPFDCVQSYHAFSIYLRLGRERSLSRVCAELNPELHSSRMKAEALKGKKRKILTNGSVPDWHIACLWVERAKAWDSYLADLERKALIDERVQLAKKHARMGSRLSEIGIESIEELSSFITDEDGNTTRFKTPSYQDAIKLVELGIKTERLAAGLDGDKSGQTISVSVGSQFNLHALDDRELDQMMAMHIKISGNSGGIPNVATQDED
jgi:hypothetical protein